MALTTLLAIMWQRYESSKIKGCTPGGACSTYALRTKRTQSCMTRLSIQAQSQNAWKFSCGKVGNSQAFSIAPCVWFALKTISNGFKCKPDAVTVTDTVTRSVDEDEVRPLTVLSPEALRVCPEDMSKKIGVWSMLRIKRWPRFGPTTFDLAYSMKSSSASLLNCSGGRWHSCVTAHRTILFEAKNRGIERSFDRTMDFLLNTAHNLHALSESKQSNRYHDPLFTQLEEPS